MDGMRWLALGLVVGSLAGSAAPALGTNCVEPQVSVPLSLEGSTAPLEALSLPFDSSGELVSPATDETFAPPRLEFGDSALVLKMERAP